jgi:hypothetical protein
MLSHVLPEQPRHQLDRLIQVPRIADGLWADSRHDVLTPRSGTVPLAHGVDLPRCSVPG